jgi:hypothetical protein
MGVGSDTSSVDFGGVTVRASGILDDQVGLKVEDAWAEVV